MKMVKWERKPLGAVADLCLGKMLDQNKNRGEPLPYLANVNVRWGEFALDDLRTMRFEPKEMDRYGLRFGDIVMCEGGEPGRCAIWKDQAPGMMIQKALHRIRPKEFLDCHFLFYSFLRIGQLKGFDQYVTGATIKHLPSEKLAKVEIEIPPLPIQQGIAGILSAYDELIENNQRRIRILEEMARSLYREWFVHFRYPGHDSPRPQAGEGLGVRAGFVDSPLGQIPQGWEVKKIAELLAKVSRQGKIKTQDYLQTGDLPVIDQGRELVGGYTNDADVEYSGELPVIVFGDHTRILKFIDFPFACGADGTQLLRSNDERMPVSLFYYTLSAIELSDFAYARHFKFLKEELVVVPIAEAATAFSERVNPIKRQVRVLQQQSDNLRRTRDLLLPRLLSGQMNLATDTTPIYDEDAFKCMVEKGAQAWADVPDSAAWVETLRGSKE